MSNTRNATLALARHFLGMCLHLDNPTPAPTSDPSPFEVWFGQTLQRVYEPVIHEALPSAILDALPPLQQN